MAQNILRVSNPRIWSKDGTPAINFQVDIPAPLLQRASNLGYAAALANINTNPEINEFWSNPVFASLRPVAQEEEANKGLAESFHIGAGSPKIQQYIQAYFESLDANIILSSSQTYSINFHANDKDTPGIVSHLTALFAEQYDGSTKNTTDPIVARKLAPELYPNLPQTYSDFIIGLNQFVAGKLDEHYPKRGGRSAIQSA